MQLFQSLQIDSAWMESICSQVVGCLYVESKTLRNSLMPIALNTLDSIKGLLLDMARDSCRIVLQDMQERIAMLQVRPVVLDDFVAYQVSYREPESMETTLGQQSVDVDVLLCSFRSCVSDNRYQIIRRYPLLLYPTPSLSNDWWLWLYIDFTFIKLFFSPFFFQNMCTWVWITCLNFVPIGEQCWWGIVWKTSRLAKNFQIF